MHRFFGKKPPKKGEDEPETMDQMDAVGERMDSRVAELDVKIEKLEKQVLVCKKKMKKARGAGKTTHKKRALQLLKQKKQYEQQRDRLMAQQLNVDGVRMAHESMKDTAEMASAMKSGVAAMKSAFAEVDVDDVDDLRDEMEELMGDAEEMNEMMSGAWGMEEFDEDDLMDELDGLEDELDDLEMEDEMPDYMVSATSSATAAKATATTTTEVDEYGLPKEKMYA